MSDFVEMKCGVCAIRFCMTREFYSIAKSGAGRITWFCTNGHERTFTVGPTTEETLRKERDTLKQQLAYKDDRIRAETTQREYAQNQARAYKGVATRVKNRVGKGVCPCCNRTFANLHRHMAGQHPTFATDDIPNHGAIN